MRRVKRVTVSLSDDEIDVLYAAVKALSEDIGATGEDWPYPADPDDLSDKLLRARSRVRAVKPESTQEVKT